MEGPSLILASELLSPFMDSVILTVEGNTKIGKEKLLKKRILDVQEKLLKPL